MTAMEMNAELFRDLSIIAEDEGLMKKAVRSIHRLASQKLAMDSNENHRPMEELDEIIRRGDKDIAEGNYRVISIEDLWK